jgi:toxin-antitoxin system PIN domain toxin
MKVDEDAYFVDTNVLVYAAVRADPRYEASRVLLETSRRGTLHISPQILTEFYSTITNAKRVAVPYTPQKAVEFLEALLDLEHVVLVPIPREVPNLMFALLKQRDLTGPRVFDAQIAAIMLAHGVKNLFTDDAADFKQFPGIEILDPSHDATVH